MVVQSGHTDAKLPPALLTSLDNNTLKTTKAIRIRLLTFRDEARLKLYLNVFTQKKFKFLMIDRWMASAALKSGPIFH